MSVDKEFFWKSCLEKIDCAFQPIVNIHSGFCYGYEALIRQYEQAGFSSIAALFNRAHEERMLPFVHRVIYEKATAKFTRIKNHEQFRLFYNIDNRLFSSQDYDPDHIVRLLAPQGLFSGRICFEISEQHEISHPPELPERLKALRDKGIKIAVDDFGVGVSGLRLLYYTRPDYIKIDRFFIQNIERDAEKRLLAAGIVDIAHQMGVSVIAEGVEHEKEYYECRGIGCDMVQGYLIQKPRKETNGLIDSCAAIRLLSQKDKREDRRKDVALIKAEIEYIKPIVCDTSIISILDTFKAFKKQTFFPIVTQTNEPVGIIRETSIKEFIYSRYGRFVLENRRFNRKIDGLVSKLPKVDIHTPIEHILNIFSRNERIEGLLITSDNSYAGFLSAHSMLKILNEKNIAIARDQNPLSNLPGNTCIYEFISRAVRDLHHSRALVYFDFDNFKVYNDLFGFRQGDRVILLFSDLLKTHVQSRKRFIGHVGGDDFFMGVTQQALDDVVREVRALAAQFGSQVKSFYPGGSVARDRIKGKDRNGNEKWFPLMTVSSVVLELPAHTQWACSPEQVSAIIATLKSRAKRSTEKLCVSSLSQFIHPDMEIPN